MKYIPTVFVLSLLFYIAHPVFCFGAITVINGDAETGDLTGWTGSSSGRVAKDILQWQYTVTPHQGDWFLSFARPSSSSGFVEQTGAMDNGTGSVLRLSGIFQTEHGDFGEAVITLLDSDNAQVAQQATGRELSRDHRWETFSVDVQVPPDAASWHIKLMGTLREGQYTNTYFDDIRLGILGDFNQDGDLTLHDLETLTLAIQSTDSGVPELDLDRLQFDLDRSGTVDPLDREHWLTDLKRTFPGDANLDGEVSFADFLAMSENFAGSGGWSEGDFDLNGKVEFSDFLVLSENFGKTSISAAVVPEPTGLIASWLGLLGLVTFRRHHRRCPGSVCSG